MQVEVKNQAEGWGEGGLYTSRHCDRDWARESGWHSAGDAGDVHLDVQVGSDLTVGICRPNLHLEYNFEAHFKIKY